MVRYFKWVSGIFFSIVIPFTNIVICSARIQIYVYKLLNSLDHINKIVPVTNFRRKGDLISIRNSSRLSFVKFVTNHTPLKKKKQNIPRYKAMVMIFFHALHDSCGKMSRFPDPYIFYQLFITNNSQTSYIYCKTFIMGSTSRHGSSKWFSHTTKIKIRIFTFRYMNVHHNTYYVMAMCS